MFKRYAHKYTKNKIMNSDSFVGIIFVLPFIAFWIYWFLVPFIQSFKWSLQNIVFTNLNSAKFIGLDNYAAVLKDPDFQSAVYHSLLIVLIAVPLQTMLSLIIAIGLNQKIKGKSLFRVIYSLPYITSAIAVTTVFMVLFRKDQLFTILLGYLGFPNVTWFSNLNLALPFIIILYIWQQTGFFMIIYLAGLQNISKEFYEAATVDGANAHQKFFHITIPLLKPVTFFIVTVGTIYAFKIYDQIAAISRYGVLGQPAGHTSTFISYFVQVGLRYMEVGKGSAAVIIFLIIILIITTIQKRLLGKEEDL